MIRSIQDFVAAYTAEREKTMQLLQAVTQASLSTRVGPEGRTLGYIAWHIVATIPEMMNKTGLKLAELEGAEAPDNVEEIRSAYAAASQELLDTVERSWADGELTVTDNMYGEDWPRSQTLLVLLTHEIHHRAQLTVLMRQAGLRVPGIYGPAREDWADYGMEAHS
ncbi:DinB family protein [bacterium]|nr:DinB family protein [bacterium]